MKYKRLSTKINQFHHRNKQNTTSINLQNVYNRHFSITIGLVYPQWPQTNLLKVMQNLVFYFVSSGCLELNTK